MKRGRKKKRKRGRPFGSTKKNNRLKNLKLVNPEKVKLIREIWKLQPDTKELELNLTKYSIEELERHIKLVKERRNK